MPNELRLQKLVVDTVNDFGGFAFKLTNKFIVGVPDLFIQLPGLGAGIWEVKAKDRAQLGEAMFPVTLTAMQERFLWNIHRATGICGVISFVETPKLVYMAAFPLDTLIYEDATLPKFLVSPLAYTALERGRREKIIVELLEKVYERG